MFRLSAELLIDYIRFFSLYTKFSFVQHGVVITSMVWFQGNSDISRLGVSEEPRYTTADVFYLQKKQANEYDHFHKHIPFQEMAPQVN
jgi:hypothetical protein